LADSAGGVAATLKGLKASRPSALAAVNMSKGMLIVLLNVQKWFDRVDMLLFVLLNALLIALLNV
jgi:hypothetical protein